MGIGGVSGSGKSTIVNEIIEKIEPKKYLYSTTMLITGIDRN